MSENKYYYLKIKEDFFDNTDLRLLENMQDGFLYSNILLKLYLLSLRNGGKLYYRDRIPYSADMLATLFGHQVGTVERAISIFLELGMVELLDNGAMFMLDIQEFIGRSSEEADRKREYRNRIEQEKIKEIEERTNVQTNVGQISDIISISSISSLNSNSCIKEKKNNKTKIKDKEDITKPFIDFTKNTDLQEALLSFYEMRKEIDKPMTKQSVTKLLNKLTKLSINEEEQIDILENSIINSWQGIFPLNKKQEVSKKEDVLPDFYPKKKGKLKYEVVD